VVAGPTDTPTDTPVVAGPTDTPADTPTDTPVVAGPTDTPTGTPTDTPMVVGPTGTPTDTPVVVPSSTPIDTPTDTPALPTNTPTPVPPPTNTPPPTITYTPTVPVLVGSSVTLRPLVQAQCAGPAPCNSLGLTFGKGKVRIQLVKPPNPVGNRVVGKIQISRVFRPQPALVAKVVGDISYGGDPNGDCPLANTQVLGAVYATSTLSCETKRGASNCKGILALPALIPAKCTDVSVVVTNAHVAVYDIAAPGSPSSLIARDGLKIQGRR
jgi:hypothetical protein